MKKQYGVIHNSTEWVSGPFIKRFGTEKEAESYINEFKSSSKEHSRDWAEVIEFKDAYEMKQIDQTANSTVYGFKKEEEGV